MKILKICFVLTLISTITFAQSTSVFDANYFNNDNTTPPLKIGKGFHINDVYRQTRSCFKPESIDSKKLLAQQEGKKTSVKFYYTKTNKDFNEFKSRGTSGKATYLNLFTLDGNKLEEYTKTSTEEEERLIFTVIVDFGIFDFSNEPILNDEAKNLIKENKLKEFVNIFGTHYISGVRKASSIQIILKKNTIQTNQNYTQKTNINTNGRVPYKGNGSLEIDNSDWINNELKNNKFSVSIEINGPTLEQATLQSQINSILNGNSVDKLNSITKIIEDVTKNITNQSQSSYIQYYYAPFSLYGLEGIYWDSKKQNDLIKLNETLISLYSDKKSIEEKHSNIFLNSTIEEEKLDERRKLLFSNLDKYKLQIEKLEKQLEQKYNTCVDVFCPTNNFECCNVDTLVSEIKFLNFESKINQEVLDFANDLQKMATQESDCYKKQQGIVKVENLSNNPYDLYIGQKYIGIINGRSFQTFYLNRGYYEFKAVQRSGFVLYPTENIISTRIEKVCQEFLLKIGI